LIKWKISFRFEKKERKPILKRRKIKQNYWRQGKLKDYRPEIGIHCGNLSHSGKLSSNRRSLWDQGCQSSNFFYFFNYRRKSTYCVYQEPFCSLYKNIEIYTGIAAKSYKRYETKLCTRYLPSSPKNRLMSIKFQQCFFFRFGLI